MPDPLLHLQRLRPVADPPATRRRQPPRLRRAALPAALPRLRAGNRQRAARAGHPVGGEASPAEPASWAKYGERDVTRREHAQNCAPTCNWPRSACPTSAPRVRELTELAQQTDKGLLLAGQALESLRQKRRILPALSVIDRACSEAIARANRRVYRALVEPLTDSHRAKLDELLKLKAGSSITG